MSISFYCESCYQIVETPDSTANKKGKCPHCGHIQLIPSQSTTRQVAPPPGPKSTVDSLLDDVEDLAGSKSGSRTPPPPPTSKRRTSGNWKDEQKRQNWGNDSYSTRYQEERERIERTSRALAIPAIGIILTGVSNYVASVAIVFAFVLYMLGSTLSDSFTPTTGVIMLSAIGWSCMIATLGIVGANHMRQVRSYSMSVGGALLMCLPHAAWPMGVIFGMWALIALAQGGIRDNFRKA